jgi:Tfp pilus assembly major pilin PilA
VDGERTAAGEEGRADQIEERPMQCKKCGTTFVEGAGYCHKCGTSIQGVPHASQANPNRWAIILASVVGGGLLLVVFIGILAAIAIPKFAQTKEKAYMAQMKSDLRNMATAQEAYFSEHKTYAPSLPVAAFSSSQGVMVTITRASSAGWAASATHTATAKVCEIGFGDGTGGNGEPICK